MISKSVAELQHELTMVLFTFYLIIGAILYLGFVGLIYREELNDRRDCEEQDEPRITTMSL